jgi:sugar phosphate isomerase/epimerase
MLRIGAALTLADLPRYRDWLIAGQRDLEIQDFIRTDLLLGDWRSHVQAIRAELEGYEGRLGLHGPFIGVPIDNNDPEVAPIITRRFLTALDICAEMRAVQMVIHSPYSTWDYHNLGNDSATAPGETARELKIAAVHEVMASVVRKAEDLGVTLVLENIEDIDPRDRLLLAQSFSSENVKLSIDTGHAHYAHGATGAPPVDYFVTAAGADLAHVHIQDADGYADRHWAPGRGSINWHAVCAAIAALPVQPHLVLELRHAADIPAAMAFFSREGLAG